MVVSRQRGLVGPGGSGLVRQQMRGSTVLAECLPSRLRFVPMLIKTANVINPAIGTSFESLEEDYEFYNLYSWEVGFGVQYVKSHLNVHQKKCVCACAGKPLQSNGRSKMWVQCHDAAAEIG